MGNTAEKEKLCHPTLQGMQSCQKKNHPGNPAEMFICFHMFKSFSSVIEISATEPVHPLIIIHRNMNKEFSSVAKSRRTGSDEKALNVTCSFPAGRRLFVYEHFVLL